MSAAACILPVLSLPSLYVALARLLSEGMVP